MAHKRNNPAQPHDADDPPRQPDHQMRRHESHGDQPGRDEPPQQWQHEDPDIRGNIDRGSDDDKPIDELMRRTDDELADEPGIGP